MRRRSLILSSAGVSLLGTAGAAIPFRYLGQSDFAKSMSNLLYEAGGAGAAKISAWDPYWIDKTLNKAAAGVHHASGNNGYDSSNNHVAYRLLKVGVPSVDIANYTGLASPNTVAYRACTAGVLRATGAQVDAAGRVGMFLNGFDTPSDTDVGGFRNFGPDIHAIRDYKSPAIYAGASSVQGLHMACTVSLGATYFYPAAGASPGAGGQIGWRGTFVREDGGAFKTFVNAAGNTVGVTEISVLVGFWDSRNLGDPGANHNDSVGNITAGEHWVGATLAAGKTSQFVEKSGASTMFGQAGWRSATFYWGISRANMVNILAAFNATTTTPEMVRLKGVAFNCELFDNRNPPAQFKPGQFGFYFENPIVDIW